MRLASFSAGTVLVFEFAKLEKRVESTERAKRAVAVTKTKRNSGRSLDAVEERALH